MAVQIGSLYVSLTANVEPFARGMSRAQAATTSAASNIRRSAGVAESSVNSFWGSVGGRSGSSGFRPYSLIAVSRAFDNAADRAGLLRGSILAATGVMGGFAAALSSNLVLRYADSFTRLTNLLRSVSDNSADVAARFELIEGVARRSRSTLEATAILYARLQKAAPGRGVEELLRYVETIQKALVLGGASAQEARSAAIQFSQAIASNRLSGDEIRAVLETPLGLELAKGLGVTIGKLREMGQAGQLTADVVLGGLAKISDGIDRKFAKSVLTLDQAILHVDNRFTSVIGHMNQMYGVTNLLAQGIVAFGDNLDSLLPTMTSVIGLLGAMYIARNKVLAGGLAGAAGGALLGGQLGGLNGAIIGGALASFAGTKAPVFIEAVKRDSQEAASRVRALQERVVDLKKEFFDAAAARRIALAAQKGDAFAAARQSLQAQVARLALDPTASIGDIYKARAAAIADGQKRLDDVVAETTDRYKHLGGEVKRTTTELNSVTRAATFAGRAKRVLGASVSSLIGLFGGPWGIAITGAITALTILGVQAQQRAQQIAHAEQLIASKIGDLAEVGDKIGKKSLLQLQVDKTKESVDDIQSYVGLLKDSFNEYVRNPFTVRSLGELFTFTSTMGQQVSTLVDQLYKGEISIDQYKASLEALKTANPSFSTLIDGAEKAAEKIDRARIAAKAYGDQLNELRKQTSEPINIFLDYSKSGAKQEGTSAALASLYDDLQVSQLKAKGLTAEAKAQQIVNSAKQNGKLVSLEAILPVVKEIEANDKLASSLKKVDQASETLAQKLARMKAESQGAFLPDIDRQVLQQARSFKVATSQMEAYIQAAQSGDFSQAPPQLVDLRDLLLYEKAAEDSRNIIQQYGEWGQIAGLAAEKQRELSIAVQNGAITASQARAAYADFLGQFGKGKYIDDIAQAVGELGTSIADDWANAGTAAEDFIKRLRQIVVQLLVIEPLVRTIKEGLSSSGGIGGLIGSLFGFGGGGGGGGGASGGVGLSGSVFSTLYHGGGDAGSPTGRVKAIPTALAMSSPRFHSGLGMNEISAILQKGEKVMTARMSDRVGNTISGLSALAAAGGGGGGNVNIYNSQSDKVQAKPKKRPDGGWDIMIDAVENRLAERLGSGRSTLGGAFETAYGLDRSKGAR